MTALTVITALGAIQGMLYLLFIAFRERHPKNLPLALLLLVFSSRLATITTWNASTLTRHPWIYPLTAPLPFLFGFLVWWYAREVSHAAASPPRRLWPHFLPWFLETAAVTFTVASLSPEDLAALFSAIFAGDPPLWLPVRNGLKVALNVVYLARTAAIAFGRDAGKLSRERRRRIRILVLVPSMVLLLFARVAIVPGASENLSGGSPAPFLLLAAAMALLIYILSFLQMIGPGSGVSLTVSGDDREPLCTPEECRRLSAELQRCLEEGAYQDPDMSLRELASRMHVNVNRLSFAVNRIDGMSFRALLNRRRLEDFLEQARADEKEDRSILDMAFDAGFPSKSTFNRVFREEYGTTPSDYLKTLRLKAPHQPTESEGTRRVGTGFPADKIL